MEYRIRNIYSSDGVTVNYDVDYVILHSGVGVLWIHTDKDKTTIMLSDKYYHVYLINNDLHIRRN